MAELQPAFDSAVCRAPSAACTKAEAPQGKWSGSFTMTLSDESESSEMHLSLLVSPLGRLSTSKDYQRYQSWTSKEHSSFRLLTFPSFGGPAPSINSLREWKISMSHSARCIAIVNVKVRKPKMQILILDHVVFGFRILFTQIMLVSCGFL